MTRLTPEQATKRIIAAERAAAHGGHVSSTAQALGITPSTLLHTLARCGRHDLLHTLVSNGKAAHLARVTASTAALNSRNAAEAAQRRQELVEDVADLLDAGERPAGIVRRVGYTKAASLARALSRAGRPDLARLFYRAEAAA